MTPTAGSSRVVPNWGPSASASAPAAATRLWPGPTTGRGLGVGLENHPQGLLADAATIRGFLDAEEYRDVGVIYDVANAVAIGEDPVAGLATLGPRLRAVHLSDSPLGQWRHDPIGSGEIDFTAIGGELRRQAYEGPVVLEILSDNPLQGLIEGAQRLVRDGWSFQQGPWS